MRHDSMVIRVTVHREEGFTAECAEIAETKEMVGAGFAARQSTTRSIAIREETAEKESPRGLCDPWSELWPFSKIFTEWDHWPVPVAFP